MLSFVILLFLFRVNPETKELVEVVVFKDTRYEQGKLSTSLRLFNFMIHDMHMYDVLSYDHMTP